MKKDRQEIIMHTRNKDTNVCHTSSKSKKDYFSKLDVKCFTDNRKFLKTVKPVFTDGIKSSPNLFLFSRTLI